MTNLGKIQTAYSFQNSSRLFSALATKTDISKLAYKIQAAKALRANELTLKKVSGNLA